MIRRGSRSACASRWLLTKVGVPTFVNESGLPPGRILELSP